MKDELKKMIIKKWDKSFPFIKDNFSKEAKEILIDSVFDSLPAPVITEDKIVEVLKSFRGIRQWGPETDKEPFIHECDFYKVAQEILKGQGWEVVASGKVKAEISELDIYFIEGKQVNSLFGGFEGKNIEIAVRVKEK